MARLKCASSSSALISTARRYAFSASSTRFCPSNQLPRLSMSETLLVSMFSTGGWARATLVPGAASGTCGAAGAGTGGAATLAAFVSGTLPGAADERGLEREPGRQRNRATVTTATTATNVQIIQTWLRGAGFPGVGRVFERGWLCLRFVIRRTGERPSHRTAPAVCQSAIHQSPSAVRSCHPPRLAAIFREPHRPP